MMAVNATWRGDRAVRIAVSLSCTSTKPQPRKAARFYLTVYENRAASTQQLAIFTDTTDIQVKELGAPLRARKSTTRPIKFFQYHAIKATETA